MPLVLAAAALLALVPFVARPVPARSASEALDAISAGAFVGSLFGVLVLVAVPVLLLGAVSPYAIRLSVAARRGGRASRRALYAISTVGSLVGTFLAALLLIPLVGTRRTFLALRARRSPPSRRPGLPRRFWLVPAAVAALLLAIPVGTVKAGRARAA